MRVEGAGGDRQRNPKQVTFLHEFVPDKEREVPYPAMQSTSAYLDENKLSHREVQVGGIGYGKDTQTSFGFRFCTTLILRSPDKPDDRGFAHIIPGDDPAGYVGILEKKFGDQAKIDGLVLKSGQEPTALLEVCRARNIPVVVKDMPLRAPSKSGNVPTAYSKDVIVRPDRREVIVNIEGKGIKKINF